MVSGLQELSSSEETPLLPLFSGFFSLQAWLGDAQRLVDFRYGVDNGVVVDMWFLGLLVSKVVVQVGCPSLVSIVSMPIPKNLNKPKNP